MNEDNEHTPSPSAHDAEGIFCPQCGTSLLSDAKFCHNCGHATNSHGGLESKKHSGLRGGLQNVQAAEGDEETFLWEGGYSWKAMVGPWILGVIVTIGLAVGAVVLSSNGPLAFALVAIATLLWILLIGVYLYRHYSVRYKLTSQRFVHESGILVRSTHRIEVIDVDDVSYRQGLVERMLDIGTIVIHSSDRTDPTLAIHGIDQATEVARVLDEARRAERIRRGLHIEAV